MTNQQFTNQLLDTIPGFSSYRTVEKTYADLEKLASLNGNIATWKSIGSSYDKQFSTEGRPGYDIYSLELTNKQITGDKPTLYVQASAHAREYTTAELATRFGEYLVNNYGKNPDVTWLLDYSKIAIVPIVNPDGRKIAEEGVLWRKNTRPVLPEDSLGVRVTDPNKPIGDTSDVLFTQGYDGVDLNRNYDFKWGVSGEEGSSSDPSSEVYRGSAPASEPEVSSVQNYVRTLFPDQRDESSDSNSVSDDATGVFIDIHSFSELIIQPFNEDVGGADNAQAIRTLGQKFANLYRTSGNLSGFAYEDKPYNVIEGSTLYPTDGTGDAWAFGTLGVAGFTWELGIDFFESNNYFEQQVLPQGIEALVYAAKAAYRPYKTPSGPDSLSVNLNLPDAVNSNVTLTAIADDTGYADSNLSIPIEGSVTFVEDIGTNDTELVASQNIIAARYTIDTPSWIPGTPFYYLSPQDGKFDSPKEVLQGTVDITGLSAGRHTIFVESQDVNGNWGVPSAVFLNILPTGNNLNLVGGDGNDKLVGGAASDELFGGKGQDELFGLEGGDNLNGGSGNDKLFAAQGDDSLLGGSGNDELFGEVGNDYLNGEEGDDKLFGGEGIDKLFGGNGTDELFGEVGDDSLDGGDGNDKLFGGLGNDRKILGGRGNDELFGEAGNDALDGQDGDDKLFGGEGIDDLRGGQGQDEIFGEAGEDFLEGGSGNDKLFGGEGIDKLSGSEGTDELFGEAGEDTLYGGEGQDKLFGGADNDSISLVTGLYAGLYGGGGNDELYGEAGNDNLFGNDGDDKLYGGEGDESVIVYGLEVGMYGGRGNDELYGEAGNDVLEGGDNNDKLFGGLGNDTLFGDTSNGDFSGESSTTPGLDELFGEDGDDYLDAGAGNNILSGGAGKDTFFLSSEGNNTILDFELGLDMFKLGQGLDFGSLLFTAQNGGTLITTNNNNQALAFLNGIDSKLLSTKDFTVA